MHDLEGVAKFDPTATPKSIDYWHLNGPDKGKTGLGIYELQGDTLRVCWAIDGLREGRPPSSRIDLTRIRPSSHTSVRHVEWTIRGTGRRHLPGARTRPGGRRLTRPVESSGDCHPNPRFGGRLLVLC